MQKRKAFKDPEADFSFTWMTENAAAEMARMKVVEEVRREQVEVSGEIRSSEMTQKTSRVI